MIRCVDTVRVWTPAFHKFIVLHDKRARRALSPGDIVLAHEIIAQFRTISKTQQPVRLLKGHLFYKVQRPVIRRQKHPDMPDKQDGFLLGRLIVEEHSDEADSFVLRNEIPLDFHSSCTA